MTAARRLVAPAVLGLLFAFAGGCQPGRGSLAGTVTHQGKLVVSGSVVLDAGDGVPRVTGIEPDGTYRFDDVPAVEVRLGVVSLDPAKVPPPLDENGKPVPVPKADRSKWVALPGALGDPRTSGVKTTISPGANTFNIELK